MTHKFALLICAADVSVLMWEISATELQVAMAEGDNTVAVLSTVVPLEELDNHVEK